MLHVGDRWLLIVQPAQDVALTHLRVAVADVVRGHQPDRGFRRLPRRSCLVGTNEGYKRSLCEHHLRHSQGTLTDYVWQLEVAGGVFGVGRGVVGAGTQLTSRAAG